MITYYLDSPFFRKNYLDNLSIYFLKLGSHATLALEIHTQDHLRCCHVFIIEIFVLSH